MFIPYNIIRSKRREKNNINKLEIAYVTDYRTYLTGDRPCGRRVL